jgi:hypothetical protein
MTGKIKKKIADFHVLVLFMAKKHALSDKKFPSVHAVAVRINFRHAYSLNLKS